MPDWFYAYGPIIGMVLVIGYFVHLAIKGSCKRRGWDKPKDRNRDKSA